MKLNIVVFDDPLLSSNFKPLTYTRATFELSLGVNSILDRLLTALQSTDATLIVPEYLKDVVKERKPNLTVNPNTIDEDTILVNGLFNPSRKDLIEKILLKNKDLLLLDQNVVAVAKISEPYLNRMLQSIRDCKPYTEIVVDYAHILKASDTLIARHPWHLLELIEPALAEDSKKMYKAKKMKMANIQIKGDESTLKVAEDALLDDFITFDTRRGPIIVDEGCEIQSFTRIAGPTYIGKRSLIKSSSIIEGSIIGECCKIGGEVSNSIILGYTNKAHLGYIGHSIIGEWVNIGAGTNNSDLKNTYGEVRIKLNGMSVNTGRIKLGCFIGDGVKTSIGTQITTGRKIGPHSHIGGLIDTDVPPFTFCPKGISKGFEPLNLEEAIKVQRRMMSRRGKELTEAQERMIRSLFDLQKLR